MAALRNLAALKRNIGNRIRQALEELQESLRNLDRAPAPQRVPVRTGSRPKLTGPQYGNVKFQCRGTHTSTFRGFESFRGFEASKGFGVFGGSASFSAGNRKPSAFYPTRFFAGARNFSTYSKFGFNQWKWRPNNAIQNFSHRTQFRSKSFTTFYKTPTLTELLKKKVGTGDDAFVQPPNRALVSAAIRNSMPSSIRLNVSLTEKFHDIVMDLARGSTSEGCYVDFALEPTLSIPSATMLHPDILAEIITNLRRFEKHVADLQQDLLRLSELGELPLKYMHAEKVIRVFFPNCDRQQLERLLIEKSVKGGVVHQDTSGQYDGIGSDPSVTSISDFDILSSCGSPSATTASSSASADDILSWDSGQIVHVEPVTMSGHVDIAEEAWAY